MEVLIHFSHSLQNIMITAFPCNILRTLTKLQEWTEGY